MSRDKAGKVYWDQTWSKTNVIQAIDPYLSGINNHINRKFHEYFVDIFSGINTNGLKLLEIGCARSQWLPYFTKEHGFDVTGIDYSEIGCAKAREVLTLSGVKGKVICNNFFNHPTELVHQFDIVISFGVIEHFEDTAECIRAFKKYLKPDGLIISIIPNLTGLVGKLQKILNKEIYDKHVLLDMEMLDTAHSKAGIELIDSRYFLSINLGVLNLNQKYSPVSFDAIKMFLVRSITYLSKIIWKIEELSSDLPANKIFSPYIVYCGKNTA